MKTQAHKHVLNQEQVKKGEIPEILDKQVQTGLRHGSHDLDEVLLGIC